MQFAPRKLPDQVRVAFRLKNHKAPSRQATRKLVLSIACTLPTSSRKTALSSGYGVGYVAFVFVGTPSPIHSHRLAIGRHALIWAKAGTFVQAQGAGQVLGVNAQSGGG